MNAHAERIRRTYDRNRQALAARPALGQRTSTSRARILDGLRCEIEEGPWKLHADMGKSSGGEASAPSPGVFGRAALGSCLAISYVVFAARAGIELRNVEVVVEADLDARGSYGFEGVRSGYGEVRCHVTLETDAAEEDVRRVLDEAEVASPYWDIFTRGVRVVRELSLAAAQGS